ncbi:MAG: hypothetical protein ABI824_16195 [Acidobacteriota bacterium]
MAKLTAAKKRSEPKQEFGLPEERKYPMPDASHARNAKARASQMEHQGKLSAADKKKIDTKADKVLGKSSHIPARSLPRRTLPSAHMGIPL